MSQVKEPVLRDADGVPLALEECFNLPSNHVRAVGWERTDDRRSYGRRPPEDWNGAWDNLVSAYEEDR